MSKIIKTKAEVRVVKLLSAADVAQVGGGEKPFDCLKKGWTDAQIYKCLKGN